MSQSARLLWVAARQNTDILPVPDPIPGMSEPHLATMLFEDSCLACGEEKREVRRRFSLCHGCAQYSMTKMYDMPKYDMFNGIPESVWSLVPATEDAWTNWERPKPGQEYWCGAHFYAPEVQNVLDQYRGLAGPQAADEFIQMRLEYVASVAKSAKAISEWLSKCDTYESPEFYPYRTCTCCRDCSLTWDCVLVIPQFPKFRRPSRTSANTGDDTSRVITLRTPLPRVKRYPLVRHHVDWVYST